MNQLNRIMPSLLTTSVTLFALHLMSIAVLSQQQVPRVAPASIPVGMAAIRLADGREVQNAPVPDLPYNGDQQCGPWQRVNRLGYYNPCNVVAQAGVPFRGWIVGQNLCAGDRIDAINGISTEPIQTIGPATDPSYPIPSTSQDFYIYYYPNGSWPERLHLNGYHLWQNPGTYSISGRVYTTCVRPWNVQWFYPFPISAQATVFQPTAPQSITTPGGGRATAGGTFKNFGRVTLFNDPPVPASGSLVLLTVDKLGILDLVTQVGTQSLRTGLQQTGGVNYVSTYVYVPPGQQYADFDVVVAASAQPGDEVTVRAECVGIEGNWKIPSHCDEVNKHPQVLTIRITR